ncbi:MAG: hypothetical protein DWQ08_07385 [Proteobacteria bacterium]|nr:MAG: hypothetical protein DWQ08_07385 [Pseudomonadota bacterium]
MLRMLLSSFVGAVVGATLVAAILPKILSENAPAANPAVNEPGSTIADSRGAAMEERLVAIHDFVEGFHHRLAALEKSFSDAERASSSASNRTLPVDSAMDDADPLADIAHDTTQQDHILSLANHFVIQDVDESWSLDTENRVLQLLSSPNTESQGTDSASLSSLRCRATLCEGLIVAADTVSLMNFEELIIDRLGTELPSIRFGTPYQDAGGTSAVFYAARRGYDMPR